VPKLAAPRDTTDVIVLRTPRETGSLPVIRLVIGGVASRHALSVERLDDLLLAVETLLRDEPVEGSELILTLSVSDDVFRVRLDGLYNNRLRQTLDEAPCARPAEEQRLDVRVLMDSLVDAYGTADGELSGSFAVEMEKWVS
jgi:hypothetical protein